MPIHDPHKNDLAGFFFANTGLFDSSCLRHVLVLLFFFSFRPH
jgi:hypothetical protein